MNRAEQKEFDVYTFVSLVTVLLGIVITFIVLVMTPIHKNLSEYVSIPALGVMGIATLLISLTVSLWSIYKNVSKCICLISFITLVVMTFNAVDGF